MTRFKDALPFHFCQSDHLVLDNDLAAKTRLDEVPRIVVPCNAMWVKLWSKT